MTEIYISLGLLLIPTITFFAAKRFVPRGLCTLMGASFGLVVSPIGLGIYYLGYMLPFIGLILIFLYAFLLSSHSAPGYEIAAYFQMKPNSTALSIERLYVELINGLIWGIFYGGIGFLIDKLRQNNNQAECKPQSGSRG